MRRITIEEVPGGRGSVWRLDVNDEQSAAPPMFLRAELAGNDDGGALIEVGVREDWISEEPSHALRLSYVERASLARWLESGRP